LELRRARELVLVAAKKKAMGSLLDSKENIAKKTKDRMELLDMELVGDKSSTETIRNRANALHSVGRVGVAIAYCLDSRRRL
jgi:hypothetical protein